MEVRQARAGDAGAICAVALSNGIALDRDALRPGLRACALDASIGRHLVAVMRGAVVGHAMAARNMAAGFTHTANLAVSIAPALQRRGIGSILVGTIKSWATGAGVCRLIAICDIENLAARSLFASQGFLCEAPAMLAYRQDENGARHVCAQLACILG